MDHATDLRLSG